MVGSGPEEEKMECPRPSFASNKHREDAKQYRMEEWTMPQYRPASERYSNVFISLFFSFFFFSGAYAGVASVLNKRERKNKERKKEKGHSQKRNDPFR